MQPIFLAYKSSHLYVYFSTMFRVETHLPLRFFYTPTSSILLDALSPIIQHANGHRVAERTNSVYDITSFPIWCWIFVFHCVHGHETFFESHYFARPQESFDTFISSGCAFYEHVFLAPTEGLACCIIDTHGSWMSFFVYASWVCLHLCHLNADLLPVPWLCNRHSHVVIFITITEDPLNTDWMYRRFYHSFTEYPTDERTK